MKHLPGALSIRRGSDSLGQQLIDRWGVGGGIVSFAIFPAGNRKETKKDYIKKETKARSRKSLLLKCSFRE